MIDHTSIRIEQQQTALRRQNRRRYAFHPIHGILATHPLKRLRHIGRVIVAGPKDPHVPRHLGFEVASSVEEAVARARAIHGPECAIAYVEQPPLVEP